MKRRLNLQPRRKAMKYTMQIHVLAEKLGWKLLTECDGSDREAKGCYCGDLLSWVDNKEKDTRPERLFNYVLRRGAASTFGNLRLYLIGAAVSGDTLVRDRFVERYDYFQTTLTAKIAERLPNADRNYLAWLLLTTMDGMLVQVQLRSPGFDFDSFVNKTVQMLQQTVALMVPQK